MTAQDERHPIKPKFRPRPLLIAAATVLFFGVLGGVYVTMTANGNGQGATSCGASTRLAAQIAPLATGDMAALAVAKEVKPVADVGFIDASGAERKLSDWRGRTVLVNLWATWCAPCRKEMPDLDILQKTLGADAFEVVAINLDRGGADKGKSFYSEIGVGELAYYHDPQGRIFRDLAAFGMPTTLLVGEDGCEIGRLAGAANWASQDSVNLIKAALGN